MNGPLTASPPANTPGTDVSIVSSFTLMVPHFSRSHSSESVTKDVSTACPMAPMRKSTSSVNSEPSMGTGLGRSPGFASFSSIRMHSMAFSLSPSRIMLVGSVQKLKLDAFFPGRFDFGFVGGHLLHAAAVHNQDFFRVAAKCGARGVNGRVSAADNGKQCRGVPGVYLPGFPEGNQCP